jgi:DHA1 family tetracycline resistance protein-like MFS transporter
MKPSNKATLATLFFIIFIDSLSYFIIIPVLLRLIAPSEGLFAPDVSEATRNIAFGFAIGLLQLAYLIFAPIMGRLSDYFGRKKVLGSCLIMAAIGFIVSIFGITLHSFLLILLGRFLGGVGASSQPIAWAAIADISAKKQKALYLSLAAFAMTLAMVSGPLVGAYLSDARLVTGFNNQLPFVVAVLLIIFNLLLLKFGFQETHLQIAQKSPHYFRSAAKICSNVRVFPLLIVLFIYEFAWSLYFQDISLYLKQAYAYTPEQSAQLITWAGVCMLFGLSCIYPAILRRFSLPTILMSCFIAISLALFTCACVTVSWVQWLCVAPLAIAVGVAYPSLLALMSNELSENEQGLVMGLSATMLALAWTSSAFLMGVLTNIFLSLPLFIAALAGVLGSVVFGHWHCCNRRHLQTRTC